MAKKLKANVYVTNPKTGESVWLEEGSDLPVWAGDLVGAHVLEDTNKSDKDK